MLKDRFTKEKEEEEENTNLKKHFFPNLGY